jgi:hypothetical protein
MPHGLPPPTLAGMHLVTASETEEGRHWRESRILTLDGVKPAETLIAAG